MDGSDYNETRTVAHPTGLVFELADRPGPLCYAKQKAPQPTSTAPRYDMLAVVVTISAALGFATLCLAIA